MQILSEVVRIGDQLTLQNKRKRRMQLANHVLATLVYNIKYTCKKLKPTFNF